MPPPPAINKDNLLIYWNFQNSSTAPAFQANSYTIEEIGTTTYVNDGPAGSKAARLSLNNRIILRSNLWNHYTGPYTSFTCSAWVRKRTLNSSPQQAVYLGSIFGPMGFLLAETSVNNNISFGIQNLNDNSNITYAPFNAAIPLVTWMHFVCVNDFVNKTIKLYINGNLSASNTYLTLGSLYSNWDGIVLNGSPTLAGSEYGNNYDYALTSIWNRALSNEEISLLYTNPTILN
jgi:hypothetical protein